MPEFDKHQESTARPSNVCSDSRVSNKARQAWRAPQGPSGMVSAAYGEGHKGGGGRGSSRDGGAGGGSCGGCKRPGRVLVPLFGWMLEGELTVAYEGAGERVYRPGDALMEALGTLHNGRNDGPGDLRILAVFMGAEGVPNTEKAEAP